MAQRFTLAQRPVVDVYGDFRGRFGTRSYVSYLGDAGPAGGTGQQRVPVAPRRPVAAQH